MPEIKSNTWIMDIPSNLPIEQIRTFDIQGLEEVISELKKYRIYNQDTYHIVINTRTNRINKLETLKILSGVNDILYLCQVEPDRYGNVFGEYCCHGSEGRIMWFDSVGRIYRSRSKIDIDRPYKLKNVREKDWIRAYNDLKLLPSVNPSYELYLSNPNMLGINVNIGVLIELIYYKYEIKSMESYKKFSNESMGGIVQSIIDKREKRNEDSKNQRKRINADLDIRRGKIEEFHKMYPNKPKSDYMYYDFDSLVSSYSIEFKRDAFNKNKNTFDWIIVRFSLLGGFDRAKQIEAVHRFEEKFKYTLRNILEHNQRLKDLGIPINYLKTDGAVLTRSSELVYTVSLKKIANLGSA